MHSRVTQNQKIRDTVKITGLTIRDWLGPYYTLGCVVMISIGFCTFIDPSGTLVRSLTGLLLFATLLAWSLHVARKRKTPAVAPVEGEKPVPIGPQLHAILFTVSLFFCAGLLISEFVMHEKRGSWFPKDGTTVPEPVPAPTPAPTPTPTPAPEPTPVPVPAPVPVPVPAPTTKQPTTTTTPAPEAAPASETTTTKSPATDTTPAPRKKSTDPVPEQKPQVPTRPRDTAPTSTPPEPRRAPTAATTTKKTEPSGDRQRCASLVDKFSLGQTLSEADKQYLETSCR